MKHWERVAIAVLIFLYLILAGLSVLPFVFEKQILRAFAKDLSRRSNINVTFSKAKLSFYRSFPLVMLSVRDLTLTGKGEFLNDTLFYAPRVRMVFDYKQLSRISKGFDFKEIIMDSAVMNFLIDTNGVANFDLYFGPSYTAEYSGEYKTTARKVYINDSKIVYIDREYGIVSYVPYVQAVLNDVVLSDRRFVTDFSAYVSGFYLKYKKYWLVKRLDFSVNAKYANLYPPGRDDYYFKGDFLLNHSLPVRATVNLKNWNLIAGYPYYDYSVKVNTRGSDFKSLVAALPYFYYSDKLDFDATGSFDFSFSYVDRFFYDEGKKIDTTDISGSLSVRDASFHQRGLPDTLRNVNLLLTYKKNKETDLLFDYAHFVFKNSYFLLKDFHARDLGDLLDISGSVYSDLDLSRLKDLVSLNFDISGRALTDLTVNGQLRYDDLSDFSDLQLDGSFQLEDFRFVKDDLNIKARQIKADFDPQVAVIRAADLFGFKTHIQQLRASAQNYFSYLVSLFKPGLEQTLDLNVYIKADTITLDSVGKCPVFAPKSPDTLTVSQSSLPTDISLKLSLFSSWIKTGFTDLYDNSLFMFYATDSLRLKFSGYIRHSPVKLELLAKLTPSFAGIDFYTAIYSYPVSEVFAYPGFNADLFPVLATARGQFDLTATGSLKYYFDKGLDYSSLRIDGKISSQQLVFGTNSFLQKLSSLLSMPQLKNPVVEDFVVDFSVKNRAIIIKPSHFKISGYDALIRGYTGFNGLISYTLKLQLPPNIATKAVNKVLKGDRNVSIVVAVFGDVKQPAMKLSADLFKRDLENVPGQALSLHRKTDSIRASLQVKADSILDRAKAKAQKILIDAQMQSNLIWYDAYKQAQALRANNHKARAKRVLKRANKKIKKLQRRAAAEHDKVIRQAKRKVDSLKRTYKQVNRKVRREILHPGDTLKNQRTGKHKKKSPPAR